MYGGTYYGSLVVGAGLVVTSIAPVPPAGLSNGYGGCVYGAGVYAAGCVVTSDVPVPPAGGGLGNGYGGCVYGAGVYAAGCVVTVQVPVPPTPVTPPVVKPPVGGGWLEYDFDHHAPKREKPPRPEQAVDPTKEQQDIDEIAFMVGVWLHRQK